MKLTDDMTKAAIHEVIKGLVDEYPELAELAAADPDKIKKQDLIDRYNEAVQGNKKNLFGRLLKEMPNAVLVPVKDLLLRLEHPTSPNLTFDIKAVEGDLGSVAVPIDRMVRQWRRPEDDYTKANANAIHATPLTDIPGWAQEQVIALIQDGTLKLFTTLVEAREVDNTPHVGGGLLDNTVGTLDMKTVYARNTGAANPPIIVEPTGQFTAAEQEAAWNVLCGEVDGEFPLPENRDDINPDPKTITKVELLHVQERINRCLEHPERFTKRSTSKQLFDHRMFFNQLLQIEFGGFTPARHAGSKNGGMRPRILKLIRDTAKASGFEVISDYVINKQERGVIKDLTPAQPFTDNRQPKLPFHANIGSTPSNEF